MKIYKTQGEIEADIKDNVLSIKGDVKFECSFSIEAKIIIEAGNIEAGDIKAWDIKAGNIKAGDIKAWNIEAWNIEAGNIKAGDIEAWNIKAGDIKAWNIEAWNIKAGNIEAGNIKAGDISFYAVCFAYFSFSCKSIIGQRNNSKYFCLDSEVVIKRDK